MSAVKQATAMLVLLTLLTGAASETAGAAGCRAPSFWDGKKCACAAGMVNCNGKCICDYGYWPVGSTCAKCDAQNNYSGKSCAGSATTIPDGYSWNGKFIIQNWTANNCGAQQFWDGLSCNPLLYPVVCKPGYNWTGDVCVRNDASSIPAGQYWNGKAYVVFVNPPVCEKSYVWDGSVQGCVYHTPKVACPSNKYYFNGTFCTGVTSTPKCSYGYYFDGTTCLIYGASSLPVCSNGTFWNGRSCILGAKTCDPSMVLDTASNSCLTKGCQRGQRLDVDTKKCVPNAPKTVTITGTSATGQSVSVTTSSSAISPVVVSSASSTTSLPTAAQPTPTPAVTPTASATPTSTPTPAPTSTPAPTTISTPTATPAPSTTPTPPPVTTAPSTPSSSSTASTPTAPATPPTPTPLPTQLQIPEKQPTSTIIPGTSITVPDVVVSQGGVAILNGSGTVVAPGATTVTGVNNIPSGIVPSKPTGLGNGLGSAGVISVPDTSSINSLASSSSNTVTNYLANGQSPTIQNGQLTVPSVIGSTVIQHPSIASAGSKITPATGNPGMGMGSPASMGMNPPGVGLASSAASNNGQGQKGKKARNNGQCSNC